jgi:hypothetical protein
MATNNNLTWWEAYREDKSKIQDTQINTGVDTNSGSMNIEEDWWETYRRNSPTNVNKPKVQVTQVVDTTELNNKKPEEAESNVVSDIYSWFENSSNAISQGAEVGSIMADATDELSKIMRAGDEASKEDIKNAFNAINSINAAPPIEAMGRWSDSYDKYIKRGDNPVSATYKATTESGTDGFLGVMAQSFTSLTNEETLAAGASGIGVGAGAGAAYGAAAGNPFTVLGGAVSGGMAGAFGFANAYSESVNRFSQNMQAAIIDSGQEVNEESIQRFLNDDDLYESVMLRSIAAGVTIGSIEGAMTLVGGKAVSTIGKSLVKKLGTSVGGKLTTKLAQGATSAVVEGAGGSLGEASAMAIEGRGFDTKEIIIEGIAGLGGAPATAAVGGFSALKTKAGKYKVNGGVASRDDVIGILKSDKITEAQKAGIDISILNDDDLHAEVSELQSDVELKTNLDDRVTDQVDRDILFDLEKEARSLENKKTVSGKNQLSSVKSKIKEITDKYESVDKRTKAVRENKKQRLDIEENIKNRVIASTLRVAKNLGSDIGFETVEVNDFDDLQNVINSLPEDQRPNIGTENNKLSEKQRNDYSTKGGFIDYKNKRAYINKDVAAKTNQVNVGGHEMLHGLLRLTVGDYKAQANVVDMFKEQLSKKQRSKMESLLENRYNINQESNKNKYYKEYLTVFSDAIQDGDITYSDNLFTKLRDVITPILKAFGYNNLSFKDSRGVYNFMKEYSKSIDKENLTSDLSDFVEKNKIEDSETQDTNVDFSDVLSDNLNKIVPENTTKADFTLIDTGRQRDGKKVMEMPPIMSQVYADILTNTDLDGLIMRGINKSKSNISGTSVSESEFKSRVLSRVGDKLKAYDPSKNTLGGWLIGVNGNLNFARKDILKEIGSKQNVGSIEAKIGDTETTIADQIEDKSFSSRPDAAIENKDLSIKSKLDKKENIQTRSTDEKLFREELGIEPDSEIYDGILDNTVKDINNNIENYYDKNSGNLIPQDKIQYKNKKDSSGVDIKDSKGNIIREKSLVKNSKGLTRKVPFTENLFTEIQESVFSKVKKMFGGKLDNKYPTFLRNNIAYIVEKANKNDLVQLQKNWNNEIFANLVIGQSIKDGKVRIEGGKSGANVKETRAIKNIGESTAKSETAGNNVYKKKDKNSLDIEDILSFFMQEKPSSILGTRKDALAKIVIKELTLDAYFKAVHSDKMLPHTSFMLEDSVLSVLTTEINRDNSAVDFSEAVRQSTGEVAIDISESDSSQILLDPLKFLRNVTSLFKSIKQLKDNSDNELSEYIRKSNYTKEAKAVVDYLVDNGFLNKKENYGGVVEEMRSIEIINTTGDVRIKARTKAAGSNSKIPDVEIKLKIKNNPTVNLEVKQKPNSRLGSSTFQAVYNSKTKKYDFILNTKENSTTTAGILENKKQDINNSLLDFLDFVKDYYDKNGMPKGATKIVEGVDINDILLPDEVWKAYQKALGSRGDGLYLDNDGNEKNLSRVSRNETIEINELTKHYASKEKPVHLISISGRLFMMGDSKVSQLKNWFKAPFLDNVILKDKNGLELGGVSLKNRIVFSKSSKVGEFRKVRLRIVNEFDNNTKRYLLSSTNKKNQVNIDNLSIDDSLVDYSEADLSKGLNDIIEQNKNVDANKIFSDSTAKLDGATVGKYKFFVPPSAEDFMGLIYSFLGKGKLGDSQKNFFEETLNGPYKRGISKMESEKQRIEDSYKEARKRFPEITKKLGNKIPGTSYTYDQAIRVHLWKTGAFDQKTLDSIGLSNAEINMLNKTVTDDSRMQQFAREVGKSTGLTEGYIPPSDYWLVDTIASDLSRVVDKVGRKKFLNEFIENKKEIFNKDNLNKIEAVYGSNFREALEDILKRMETGTNRSEGSNRLVNRYTKWLNNSVGAIMFFNMRSATLQTISAANFMNWSDNNPLMAAKAFANQKQFWEDFVMIFNSDKLKQRRKGLKTDVNTAELASSVADSKDKAKAALNYLLKIGFAPTQLADSFAIAVGGASMYRNRVNTFKKQGMSIEEAQKAAFEDFAAIAEESQQSSDPSLVSQQQSGPLGRFILAFQNTPMQYNRLMKKAMRDLKNGRGDWKTNLSKIVYYGAVQNLIFSTLSNALFAMAFDDESEEEKQDKINKKEIRVVNNMIDTILRGSGVGGAAVATIKNGIMKYYEQENKKYGKDHAYTILELINYSPPIGKKLRNVYSAIKTAEWEKDVIVEKGFSLDSPIYKVGGSLTSAAFNIPLDRVVNKAHNVAAALDNNNSAMQRVLLGLGWNTWDLNVKNEENELIKANAKDARRKEGYKKAAETRNKNNSKRTKNKRTKKRRTIN